MKNTIKLLLAGIVTLVFSSCIHNEFDEPPLKDIPEGNILTVEQLRQLHTDSAIMMGETSYKFVDDLSVFAIVSMDDKSGNIYKSAYVEDYTAGINLRLLSSGGIYQGDSVRIYLKGTVISSYRGMLQLDSVDTDKNIIKQATKRDIEPEVVTIGQIKAGAYQARLIKLEDVQFVESDLSKSFANPITLTTENREIENCNGERIIVRTSGYANFAGQTVPQGKGSLIALVGLFDSTWQLYIRSTNELNMDGNRCGVFDLIFSQDFNSVVNGEDIALPGWKNINQNGNLKWKGVNTSSLTAAQISSDGNENTTWLITPKINVGTASKLGFSSRAGNTLGAELEVLVSTDYSGGNDPQNSNWTVLNNAIIASQNSGFSSWINSGNLSLAQFAGDIYIAFRYKTQTGQTGQYFIDNVNVFNE